MNKVNIIGLPVPISDRFRIVLDQGLCKYYGIPRDGRVRMKCLEDSLYIFPESAEVQDTEIKQVTIGRLNLPMQWVRSQNVQIGGQAFLMAADDCIQVRINPWESSDVNRIFGIPLKIFKGSVIYIPKSFWAQYDINPEHDWIIRSEYPDRLDFRKFRPGTLCENETVRNVFLSSVHIHPGWMESIGLKINDTVWLIGTATGIIILPRRFYENFITV